MVIDYLQNLLGVPVLFVVVFGLLVWMLGPSALVGVAVIMVFSPMQALILKHLSRLRKKVVVLTDGRVKMCQEMLQGIAIVKLFAWEESFLERLGVLRRSELHTTRIILLVRSIVATMAQSITNVSSVLTFIVYVLAGNDLAPASVFASMALFNLILVPAFYLPVMLAMCADGHVSLERIRVFLLAEENAHSSACDEDAPFALQIKHGSFIWE
ncbi:ABC transporter type 1, transmembrane domain-containing protein, partial [Syncephalis pseudoplumigaleata]